MKNLFVAVALSLIVVAAAAPLAAQDSDEIRARSAAWAEALNAGDIDALVSLYADDARIMPPNAAAGRGHNAVRKSFGAMIDANLSGALTSVEAAVAGGIGYHTGNYEITAGDAVVDRGKFMEAWRKVDGEWKMAADIWNSDGPGTGGGTLLVGTHEVKDAAVWLAAWNGPDSRRAEFAAHGAPGVRVFQSPDNPNLTGLVIQVEDMDALTAWLQSEEGTKAKAEDGVIESTLRLLTEVE
jgi:ketosteroid isomerase-like protein